MGWVVRGLCLVSCRIRSWARRRSRSCAVFRIRSLSSGRSRLGSSWMCPLIPAGRLWLRLSTASRWPRCLAEARSTTGSTGVRRQNAPGRDGSTAQRSSSSSRGATLRSRYSPSRGADGGRSRDRLGRGRARSRAQPGLDRRAELADSARLSQPGLGRRLHDPATPSRGGFGSVHAGRGRRRLVLSRSGLLRPATAEPLPGRLRIPRAFPPVVVIAASVQFIAVSLLILKR